MRRFPRTLAVPVLAVFLSGCAMPLPVQVASMIADGISWFSTDKTLTDHAISLAANEDCSVWRGFSGDAICRDGADDAKDGAPVMANAEVGDGKESVTADTVASGDEKTVVSKAAPVATTSSEELPQMMPIAVTRAELATTVNMTGKKTYGRLHFVLASFSVADNARRLVDGNPLLSPTIVTVKVLDRTMHRVVVGPFMKEERKTLARRIAKAGFNDAWIVRIEANKPRPHDPPPNYQLADAFR